LSKSTSSGPPPPTLVPRITTDSMDDGSPAMPRGSENVGGECTVAGQFGEEEAFLWLEPKTARTYETGA